MTFINSNRSLKISIENQLALPIVVTINGDAMYTQRIEANSSKSIKLLSEAEFPARVRWHVVRNRAKGGTELGAYLQADFRNIDPGAKLVITNIIGTDVYFYPVVNNNTDHSCSIVVNDGLSIESKVGLSSSHTRTNLTGYFPFAKNSNVTLLCPDQTYWHGKRQDKDFTKLTLQSGSGIADISFP